MKTTFKLSAVAISLLLVTSTLLISMKPAEEGGYDWMKARLDATKGFTLEVLNAMPADDYTFRPNEDQRTFAAQAYHIAYSIEYFIGAFQNSGAAWSPGDENSKKKEELVKWATEQFDKMNTLILSKEASDPLTAGVISYLDHNAHHRGQIITYLRLKGITPPAYR